MVACVGFDEPGDERGQAQDHHGVHAQGLKLFPSTRYQVSLFLLYLSLSLFSSHAQ